MDDDPIAVLLLDGRTVRIRPISPSDGDAAAEQLWIRPWVPGARRHFVKIMSERVSGRAFGDVGLD